MEKINISLASGTSIEKPLVTAFKGNAGVYVVLDNEANGTMGLPIILVSKLENNILNIVSEEEWNAVKESLRLIIAGNQVDYVAVAPTLSASDTFYKQLTLPVASFDALKNNYKPATDSVAPVAPVAPAEPQVVPAAPAPEVVTPVAPVMPEAPVSPAPVSPGEPQVVPQVIPVEPTPVVASVAPVVPEPSPVVPNVEPIPEPAPQPENQVDFTADKEAFLKACENMFDALVAKFKN